MHTQQKRDLYFAAFDELYHATLRLGRDVDCEPAGGDAASPESEVRGPRDFEFQRVQQRVPGSVGVVLDPSRDPAVVRVTPYVSTEHGEIELEIHVDPQGPAEWRTDGNRADVQDIAALILSPLTHGLRATKRVLT